MSEIVSTRLNFTLNRRFTAYHNDHICPIYDRIEELEKELDDLRNFVIDLKKATDIHFPSLPVAKLSDSHLTPCGSCGHLRKIKDVDETIPDKKDLSASVVKQNPEKQAMAYSPTVDASNIMTKSKLREEITTDSLIDMLNSINGDN